MATGTPEEKKAAVQGTIAYFGTCSVSEAERDNLTFTNPTPSVGTGTAQVVWRRAK